MLSIDLESYQGNERFDNGQITRSINKVVFGSKFKLKVAYRYVYFLETSSQSYKGCYDRNLRL